MFGFGKKKEKAPAEPPRAAYATSNIPKRRLLDVEIVEARGIIACVKNGSSDPILNIAMTDLGGREIKAETFKTTGQSNTLAPRWQEKFQFGLHYDLDTTNELPSLQLQMFHKAPYTVSEIPMGDVIISLDTVDPGGAEMDLWFPLEKSKAGRMDAVSGEVRVKLKFNKPPTGASGGDLEAAGGEEDIPLDNNGDPVRPNELHITAIQGRRLPIMDKNLFSSGGTSDPQMRFKIDGFDQKKTKYIRKELNPVWNEKVVFEGVEAADLSVTCIVEDHNDIKPTCDFMGKIAIPLQTFDDMKPHTDWYILKSKTMDADGLDRGEVQLKFHWKYSTKVAEDKRAKEIKYQKSMMGKMTAKMSAVKSTLGLEDSDDDGDEVQDDALEKAEAEEAARPKTAEELEAEKKANEEKKKELEDITIVDGDYQIQVHIIECRELKAENLDGTSDPIVYVECFGQKQNTICIPSCTSCVFDELLIFDMKNLDKSAFEEGLIKISCYDSNSNPLGKNTMIGAYACDATYIYSMNKDHELYRAWVPLMDDEDPEDTGTQGYMKLSINIIGPGEKLKVHDEDAERAAEIAKEAAAGGDLSSLLLSTPVIRKEWKFIVATIYKCEGLPVMDGKVGMGVATMKKAGTDAFCKLSFAGGPPLKSKVVTKSGENRIMISPEFNTEMWYPVSIPSMTQVIKFSVWDQDPEKNELIGNITEKLNFIDKCDRSCGPLKWYNMYGAPEFKQGGLVDNLKKGADAIKKSALEALGADIDWGEYYNNVPDKATAFKGRALMRFRVESKRPDTLKKDGTPKYDTAEVKPFKRKTKPLLSKQLPPTREFLLQALVVCGTELPAFGAISKDPLRIKLSIGVHEISTKPAKFEKGQCRWNEFIVSEKLQLPQALDQIPDIFIHILKDDLKPVCFYRLKPVVDLKTGELLGFDRPAQWFLMQEDKSIDALADDVFPGSVLAKIGFGYLPQAEEAREHWNKCLEKSKQGVPYQARVHIYQARNLPAADANGLCDPYIKVNYMGQSKKTKTVKKNVYPGYYETLIFDDVMIPEYENFEYASQVCFRLYDYDLDGDDYLGTCAYNVRDAIITQDPHEDFSAVDPKWVSFFREVPGDSQGDLLVLVQLIPTHGKAITKECRSIIPETRKAYIEMIAIGIRDMAPFNFQPMNSPYMEVELNSFGTSYVSETAPSKRPNGSNPNFLEKLLMPVSLPLKAIYAAPLQIRARDYRLGGWMKPVVGVCQIDLTTKLPWTPEYVPPQSDVFMTPQEEKMAAAGGLDELNGGTLPGENIDPISLEMMEMKNKRAADMMDDYVASPEPVSVDRYIQSRVNVDDTGAGVFGALNHMDATGSSRKKRTAENAFDDPDWNEDDGDQPPAWSINRKKLDAELEDELKTTPFETYKLIRGQANGLLGSTIKVVGKLKGLIRVLMEEDEPPLLSPELMEELMKPKSYVVRLYCLRGIALAAMDFNMFGGLANSDPYLKVSLGKKKFDDRDNAVDDVKDVDFYKMIEFDAELPGTSQLNISVMDKDTIGSDDLIGKTTIDLEDRWFDARWQSWGEENLIVPGQDPKDKTKVRWQTKPVERRSLYIPSKNMSQGVLECWVDIMKPEVASTFPPDDVALPPTQMFEVRVVIWKSKNVPPMDELEGMSDLYVKAWPEGSKPQETDTHWRCKKGKASWNWRMVFDVELGHSTRAMKFPYFHLQLWDRDLLKWNDCAGEGTIDLGRYYRKAYKKNVALKLFETKKGAAAKRKNTDGAAPSRMDEVEDTLDDIPPDEEPTDKEVGLTDYVEQNDELDSTVNPMTTAPSSASAGGVASLLPPRDEPDSDDDDDDVGMGAIPSNAITKQEERRLMVEAEAKSRARLAHEKARIKKKAEAEAKKRAEEAIKKKLAARPWSERIKFWKKAEPEKDAEGKPLLAEDEEEEEEEEVDEAKQQEQDDKESIALINTFKEMTGLWDIMPDDSTWYHIENKDTNDPTKITPMGSICYGIQIWPKDKAVAMPAGPARNDPNTNPFCPPPTGRLKFSWNPFVMGAELCGPALCAKFFCCLICLGFLALMIFCQPALNIIINIIFLCY